MEKREGYKKTKIGWIPEDWDFKKIDECCEKITDGSHLSPQPLKDGPLIATVKDMSDKDFNYETCTNISQEDFEALVKNGCSPQKGDVLFSKDGTIGKTFVFNNNKAIVLLSSIAILRPMEKDLISVFLSYVLESSIFYRQLEGLKSGSALRRLVLKAIREIKTPIPTLTEQKKIASILTTVDDKISSIEHQIQQTEQLKKGLMEKLLTEGIGHTEFKETKIGRIPKGWDVVQIQSVIKELKSGLSRRLSIQDIGIPVLRSNNIQEYGVDFSELKYWYIQDTQGANTENYILEDGDILINFINSMAQIGKTAIFQNEINRDTIYTTNILKMSLATAVDTNYIHILTKTVRYKHFIQSITKPAVNQASFTTKDFKRFFIPLPPLEEQKEIATILSTVDDKIEVLTQKKTQYQTLKKGLSQQLLTGQMRVKI